MESLEENVKRYIDHFPSEKYQLAPLFDYIKLTAGEDSFDRNNARGHVTASGIVMQGGSLLMIKHPWLDKWLQPGGHVESGETPIAAAQREVQEETGLISSVHSWHVTNLIPVDIDIHQIPENKKKLEPPHHHFDFRYLLTVLQRAPMNGQHLATWIEMSKVKEPNLARLIEKINLLSIASE